MGNSPLARSGSWSATAVNGEGGLDRRLMGGDSGGERTCDLVGRDAWIGVGPARTSLAGHGRERFDGSCGIVDAAHPLHLRQPGLYAPLAPALGVHAADDHRPRARHRVGAKLRCGVVVLVHSGDIGRHYFGRDIRVGIDVSHGSVGLSASGGVRRAARCVFAEDRATCVFSGRCREETEDRPSRCSHRGHFS